MEHPSSWVRMPPNESAQKSAAKPGAGDGVVLDRPVGNWAPRGASGQVCRAPWGARLIAYTGLMDMAHQGAAARLPALRKVRQNPVTPPRAGNGRLAKSRKWPPFHHVLGVDLPELRSRLAPRTPFGWGGRRAAAVTFRWINCGRTAKGYPLHGRGRGVSTQPSWPTPPHVRG